MIVLFSLRSRPEFPSALNHICTTSFSRNWAPDKKLPTGSRKAMFFRRLALPILDL
jgi:hypothetical protein